MIGRKDRKKETEIAARIAAVGRVSTRRFAGVGLKSDLHLASEISAEPQAGPKQNPARGVILDLSCLVTHYIAHAVLLRKLPCDAGPGFADGPLDTMRFHFDGAVPDLSLQERVIRTRTYLQPATSLNEADESSPGSNLWMNTE